MDGEENVRIFACRQENVIIKKSADVLKFRSRSTVMALLSATCDLPQNAIPATKSRFGRPPKTTKHTDDLL